MLRYGITIDDYDALHAMQDGKCAICERSSRRRLHVDHDHVTGLVRGLLCNSCNLALGQLGDDHERVRRAADYLKRDTDG